MQDAIEKQNYAAVHLVLLRDPAAANRPIADRVSPYPYDYDRSPLFVAFAAVSIETNTNITALLIAHNAHFVDYEEIDTVVGTLVNDIKNAEDEMEQMYRMEEFENVNDTEPMSLIETAAYCLAQILQWSHVVFPTPTKASKQLFRDIVKELRKIDGLVDYDALMRQARSDVITREPAWARRRALLLSHPNTVNAARSRRNARRRNGRKTRRNKQ